MLRNWKWTRIALTALLAAGLVSGALVWAKKPPKDPPPEPPPPPPITYQITFLGTLGGSSSEARDININGTVVGYAMVDGTPHAFLCTADGDMVDLNVLAPASGWELRFANGINDLGWIVGTGRISINGSEEAHAFRYIPREGDWPLVEDLGKLSPLHVASVAYGINLIGEVCGYSRDADNKFPFYHSEDSPDETDMVDILDGLPTAAGAQAINLHGDMIGWARYGEYAEVFRVTPDGVVTWFSAPATRGGNMFADDINDSGQFVGKAAMDVKRNKSEYVAYRHDGITALNLGAGHSSNAYGINNHGDVVGYLPTRFRYDGARPRDPLRTPGFVYLDGLDVLVDLDDAVVVGTEEGDLAKWLDYGHTIPEAINDSGVICGTASSPYEAFVLTPVEVPAP